MKLQYRYMHDIKKKSVAKRQTMPFYKVLSGFCTKDKVTETPHPYGTTDGWEESLAGTLLEEEVQKGHRTMGQLGVQEQVPRGRKTRGQLLELAHEDSSIGDVPCIIIRCRSQVSPTAGPECP